MSRQIDLYAWSTPNGYKPIILLEELELPYTLHLVNLGADEQKRPEYLALNPNGKIPTLVDDGLVIFESGAILTHLAEQEGRFLPTEKAARAETFVWLFFQVAGLGPNFGQAAHFTRSAPEKTDEPLEYATKRYVDEARRLTRVLEQRLSRSEFLGGGEYTVADITTYPWLKAIDHRFDLGCVEQTHLSRWMKTIAERPAVQRAYEAFS